MAVVERAAKVVNPLGLHARPAAEFVKIASRFRADVSVKKDEEFVNGKSILGVMTIAAEFGSALTVRAEGEDAEAAVAALIELIDQGFNEL